MTSIIIPGRTRHNRLHDALTRTDEATFRNGVALTAAFTSAMRRVMDGRKMEKGDAMNALLTTLVSFVQAQAPVDEWDDVGAILAGELRARLTVTGDTGEDEHARRMI